MLKNILDRFKALINNLVDTLFYFLRQKNKGAVPRSLILNITNICNASCVFCSYPYQKGEKAIINETDFQKAVREFKDMGGVEINFTPLLGEIFVDKDIINKIRFVKSFNFEKVYTYTNASLIHRFNIDDILSSGLTEMIVSTAPLHEETYHKIYRNNTYKQVVANIRSLLKQFNHLKSIGSKELTVKKLAIDFRSDRPIKDCLQLPDYLEYVQPYLSKDVAVGGMRTFDPQKGSIKDNQLVEGMMVKNTRFLPKILPCARSSNIDVGLDGVVRICGAIIDLNKDVDELTVGNIRKNSLKEIYNGSRVKDFKKSFLLNKNWDICKNCSWYEV